MIKGNNNMMQHFQTGMSDSIMQKIILDLWFERKDIVSDGFDRSLDYISKIIPINTVKIPTGTECWTWIVPPKWSVSEGWIRSDNKKYLDLADHPLHILSYSQPVKMKIGKDELMSNIYTDPIRPDSIPYRYSYYEKRWGFCLQHNKLSTFENENYEIYINSHFSPGELKIGEFVIPGKLKKEITLIAHLCHPCMANDNLSGVAVLVAIAKELMGQGVHKYTYRFLFVPETIGSIAYLSKNEHLIENIKYGIVVDCVGHNDILSLQHSKQATTELDNCARYVLQNENVIFREGPINKVCVSDELVFNGPGINIPTISISRFKFWSSGELPYPEYHSSDDTPDIIHLEKLIETKKIVLKILEILNSNFIPKRNFKGRVFLSRYGLWVDWRKNRKLNSALEDLMFCLEGDKSVLEIARELEIPYNELYIWLDRLKKSNLIEKI